MKSDLQKLIVPSLPLTALIYVVSFVVWMLFYIIYKYPYPMPGKIGSIAESFLSSQSLAAYLLSYAIVVVNSMVIAQMNNRFSFIRTRTFLPTFVYLLVSVCWLPLHGNYVANLAAFFVLLAVFMSLVMYKMPNGVEQAFLSFFLLALSTFLVPDYAYLIVLFWMGYFFLKCFSPRVFFASVFGFVTPWILYLSVIFFIFNEQGFVSDIPAFFYRYSVFHYDNIPAIIYVLLMILIVAISLVQMIAKSRQDSIQARNELNFLKLLFFGVAMLFVLRFSNYISYLPLIAMFFSVFTAYTFTLIRNLFNFIVFIALVALSFLFAFYIIII